MLIFSFFLQASIGLQDIFYGDPNMYRTHKHKLDMVAIAETDAKAVSYFNTLNGHRNMLFQPPDLQGFANSKILIEGKADRNNGIMIKYRHTDDQTKQYMAFIDGLNSEDQRLFGALDTLHNIYLARNSLLPRQERNAGDGPKVQVDFSQKVRDEPVQNPQNAWQGKQDIEAWANGKSIAEVLYAFWQNQKAYEVQCDRDVRTRLSNNSHTLRRIIEDSFDAALYRNRLAGDTYIVLPFHHILPSPERYGDFDAFYRQVKDNYEQAQCHALTVHDNGADGDNNCMFAAIRKSCELAKCDYHALFVLFADATIARPVVAPTDNVAWSNYYRNLLVAFVKKQKKHELNAEGLTVGDLIQMTNTTGFAYDKFVDDYKSKPGNKQFYEEWALLIGYMNHIVISVYTPEATHIHGTITATSRSVAKANLVYPDDWVQGKRTLPIFRIGDLNNGAGHFLGASRHEDRQVGFR